MYVCVYARACVCMCKCVSLATIRVTRVRRVYRYVEIVHDFASRSRESRAELSRMHSYSLRLAAKGKNRTAGRNVVLLIAIE